jgi:F-type H+-transporting ATPase subunit delta
LAAIEPAAKRYALAAFELAKEGGDLERWASALDSIAGFMGEADVARALENSRYSQETKLQLIEAGLRSLGALPMNLARLLVRKGRTALARDIAEEFRLMLESERGIARVTAKTAIALSDAERDALLQRLRSSTGKQVVLTTNVDPALLGGVVVQIGDRLIDASTRAKLEALRETLVGSLA